MRFRILNKNPLYDYREVCKITEGRDLFNEDSTFKPKDEVEYWIKQIVANHSTLRSIHFHLVDTRPKSVIMQIIRATKGHPQPEVQSSRPDWTGKERSSDPYEDKLLCKTIQQRASLKWLSRECVTGLRRIPISLCLKW